MDLMVGCGDRLRADNRLGRDVWGGPSTPHDPPGSSCYSLGPSTLPSTRSARACVSVCLYVVEMGFGNHGSTRWHLIRKNAQVWGFLQKSRRGVVTTLGFSDVLIPGELRFCTVEGHTQSKPSLQPPDGEQAQTLGQSFHP